MNYYGFFPTMVLWWYGNGILDLFEFLKALFSYIEGLFSIEILLKTLFAPWKRLVSGRRPGLEGFRDWALDNFVSRSVGFLLRLALIFIFFISVTFYLFFSVLAIIFWLGFPFILIYSFVHIFIGN